MLGRIAGAVRFKEPLAFHTSLRIGGPAEFFIAPHDVEDVRYALAFAEQERLPVVVIGGGNNLLVSEQGIAAVVLSLQGVLSRVEFHGQEAVVGCGMSLSGLTRAAAAVDLGGLEFLAGIPGTVGGALAMNAGTRDGSLGELCSAIYYVHPDGTLGEFRPIGLPGAAQTFELPPGGIFVGCRLRLTRRPAAQIHKDLAQRRKQRKATQPFALATAGYVWKNPPGEVASRLIDAVGMRGKRMNGAEVCAKCSNLIVNRGVASHTDVLALMDMARVRVEHHFGIALRPAIRTLGIPATPSLETEPLELIAARN
jgi:UDP-N-acetylmuramate dehydrogenase